MFSLYLVAEMTLETVKDAEQKISNFKNSGKELTHFQNECLFLRNFLGYDR